MIDLVVLDLVPLKASLISPLMQHFQALRLAS